MRLDSYPAGNAVVMLKMQLHIQRFILGTFVVLWTCVLPWLCWGGWSSAHHPHPSPHFVFAKPPLYGADHQHSHPSFDDYQEQTASVGAAHPDTLLITLLALFIALGRIVVTPRAYRTMRNLINLLKRTSTMAVPTPPPRILAFY